MFQDGGDYRLIKQCFKVQGVLNKMRLFFLIKCWTYGVVSFRLVKVFYSHIYVFEDRAPNFLYVFANGKLSAYHNYFLLESETPFSMNSFTLSPMEDMV